MIEFAIQCTASVAPETVMEIIRVESSGQPLALHVNGLNELQPVANSPSDAAQLTRTYIDAGYTVDMGLMQINTANLNWLNISSDSIEVLFTPCANINAGTRLLHEAYVRASNTLGPGQSALQAALSVYNTGSFDKGFKNGYVARYVSNKSPLASSLSTEILNTNTTVLWTPPKTYLSSAIRQIKKENPMSNLNNPLSEAENLENIDPLEIKLSLLNTVPGLVIEMDPDEADKLGAFEEDALSFEDALEGTIDNN